MGVSRIENPPTIRVSQGGIYADLTTEDASALFHDLGETLQEEHRIGQTPSADEALAEGENGTKDPGEEAPPDPVPGAGTSTVPPTVTPTL